MSSFPCLVRCVSGSGQARYRLGDRLVDRYLEFVAGRCRPNTLRAVAFDLKTFFTVVGEGPGRGHGGGRVRVPGRSAGRPHGGAAGRPGVGVVGADDRPPAVVGVGPVCVPGRAGRHAGAGQPGAAGPVDPAAGRASGRGRCRWCGCRGRCRRSSRRRRRTGWSARCARTGTGRWCWRCCWPGCAAARCWGCGSRTCRSLTGGWSSPRARAAITGSSRPRTGSSPRSATTCTTSGRPRRRTDRVFVVLKGPRRGLPLSAEGLDEILDGARSRAGLEHATCHQLRHTCLTRLREAGMALEAVQAQAGHRIDRVHPGLPAPDQRLARRGVPPRRRADRRRHGRGRRDAGRRKRWSPGERLPARAAGSRPGGPAARRRGVGADRGGRARRWLRTMRRYLRQLGTFLAPGSVDAADNALRQFARWMITDAAHRDRRHPPR